MASRYRRAVVLCFAVLLTFVLLQILWLVRQKETTEEVIRPLEIVQEPRLVLPKRPSANDQSDDDLPKEIRPASSKLRVHYKFAYMLDRMGFPDPRPRTMKEKNNLDNFLASVQRFAITKREHAVFVDLWLTFDRFCREQNFTYVLFFGTLLGAFRHHGMVPWDDDIDLLMRADDLAPFIVLMKDHPDLTSTEKSTFVYWVFFRDPKKSLPHYGSEWSWPYLELHFYDASRAGRILHDFNNCRKANVKDFYPVVRVPFEGHTAPVPRCMDKLMLECYENALESCCTKNYDHRHGEDLKSGECIACESLREVFPFVTKRRLISEGVYEEDLRLNGTLLARRKVTKGRNC